MQKVAVITILSLTLFFPFTLPVQADYLYDRSGTLISIDGSVLGDDDTLAETENEDDEDDDVAVSASPSPSTSDSESVKRREEQKHEQAEKQLERQIEERRQQNERKELKSQLEIKTENGKFKLKQEIRDQNGRVTSKDVELKRGESLHIENAQGERTEIKPLIMERKEERQENRAQKLELIKEKVRAQTNFDLSVNEDNELIITKPDGSSRVVSILPDQAVAKLQENGILVENVTPELTENEAGEAVYKVTQEEERRILGFALKFKRSNEVSAETGRVTTTSAETNPVKRWLERFVF